MGARSTSKDGSRRLRRRWVHPAPAALLAASLGALLLARLVLEAPPLAERDAVARVSLESPEPAAQVPDPTAVAAVDSWTRVPPPARTSAVMAQHDPGVLTSWCRDVSVPAPLRFTSLRRLEALAPDQAVCVAAALARDPVPTIRTNAIATLATSDAELPRQAVGRLRGRDALLARTLAAACLPGLFGLGPRGRYRRNLSNYFLRVSLPKKYVDLLSRTQ